MTPIGRRWIPPLAAAGLALVLYAVCIGGTYIYDDILILKMDERLTDPRQWGRYWTESYNQGVDNLYRPLVSMSFAIQWWLHGDRPWAFHLVNILLHAAVSACVAEFARRLIGFGAAMVAGLLFAAHPIHVEAVAGIVGRAELMCALGAFGALILVLDPLTPLRSLAIAGCFVVALLSKEQGMLVPLLLLALVVATRGIRRSSWLADPGSRLLILLLCWMLAGYVLWRESILKFGWDRNFIDWTINPMIPTPMHPHGGSVGADRWLMPLVLLGHYVKLLLAPIRLSIDYGAGVIGWHARFSDPYLWLGIAAVMAWCGVLYFAIRKRAGAAVFAALGLAMTYGIVGNIVTLIGTNFAERLMYLPSAFFLILVGWAAAGAPRSAVIAVLSVVLVLASVRTVTYAARWNDRLAFYATSAREQPRSVRIRMLLTAELLERGRAHEAEQVVAEARQLLPEYWEIWLHSGVVAMELGKFDEAHRHFERAVQIRPSMKIEGWMAQLAERRAATQSAQP